MSCHSCTGVGRLREFGVGVFTDSTGQGIDFGLISTLKMETRYPVEGYFGSEFPVICNHCRVMAA